VNADDPSEPAVDAGDWLDELRAAGATGDPLHLVTFWAQSCDLVDDKLRASVRAARATGCTWAQVGDALGVSRQSAWERFRSEDRKRDDEPLS
jgi:hypothetical protein